MSTHRAISPGERVEVVGRAVTPESRPAEEELEPIEHSMDEVVREMTYHRTKAREHDDKAQHLYERYLDLAKDEREVRRRLSRGVPMSDGARLFGIEVVPDEQR